MSLGATTEEIIEVAIQAEHKRLRELITQKIILWGGYPDSNDAVAALEAILEEIK